MIASKSDLLVIDYAFNRMKLKKVNNSLQALLNKEREEGKLFAGIDITRCRDEWYEKKYAWDGWVSAVSDSEDDITKEEKELAVLLDEKAKLRAEAGQIKRNIYAAGASILKPRSKDRR